MADTTTDVSSINVARFLSILALCSASAAALSRLSRSYTPRSISFMPTIYEQARRTRLIFISTARVRRLLAAGTLAASSCLKRFSSTRLAAATFSC